MILFIIIVARNDNRNNAVLRLSDTRTSGISQKKPRKNINGNAIVAMQGDHRSIQEAKTQPITNIVHPSISGKVDVLYVTTKNRYLDS